MFNRKILLALIVVILLNGYTSPSAMIGPVYTLSSTGKTFQAGLSYGSNELITQYTGKTLIENLTELRVIEENENQNIKNNRLELLKMFCNTFDSVIDFSKLEGL